jgi:hypothetical protein
MEAGWLVIPFDRPVQVAARSIVGLASISTRRTRHSGRVKDANPESHRLLIGIPGNDGIRRHVSTNPVLEPLAAESLCP